MDNVHAPEGSPVSPETVRLYGTFRNSVRSIMASCKKVGHSALAEAMGVLQPVADLRIRKHAAGMQLWPTTHAISAVVDEATTSLEALNRVAPDAPDDQAATLLKLHTAYTTVVEQGAAVIAHLEKDERALYPDDTVTPATALG